MRLIALIATLCLAYGCAYQPIEEPSPQVVRPVLGDKDCAPYAPNNSVALTRDFEARLMKPVRAKYFPKPHCWYITPGGELLLRAGQPLSPANHEYPDLPCAKRAGIPQGNPESPEAEAPGSATLNMRGYRTDRSKGMIVVCYVNQGVGWHVTKFSVLSGN